MILCHFCFSVDFLKQAESLYNELDLTERGVSDVNERNVKMCYFGLLIRPTLGP